MRIGLDVRYISHGLTGGVRTYVYHLARELPRCAPNHFFFYYADSKGQLELTEVPGNVVVRILPWQRRLSSIRNDIWLGRWMERDAVDIAHCPGNYGFAFRIPLVVTVHDALNVFPMSQHLRGFGWRPRQVALMFYLGRMTRLALRRANHVITVSEHARRDVHERTGYPLERMTAIHEAAADDFAPIRDPNELGRLRAEFGLEDRIILADGIKNPAAAIAAFRALPTPVRARTQLVFFSRESTPRPPVKEALPQAGIRFIPQPSTAELVGLMNLARVFVFPSWYEGFGIPLVEAMRCGTPVVASSRGAIVEVLGDAGLVFDLEQPEAFVAHLERVLECEASHRELRAKALARAEMFTWRKTAERTLIVYEGVVATCRAPAAER